MRRVNIPNGLQLPGLFGSGTCVEQVVEALVQLRIHRRLSSRFPVHVSGLALAVPAVLGALPVGAVLTPIPERDQQNLQTQEPEPREPNPELEAAGWGKRKVVTHSSCDIDRPMSLPVCRSVGQKMFLSFV